MPNILSRNERLELAAQTLAARDPATPLEVLDDIARNPLAATVQEAVARNRSLAPGTLLWLSVNATDTRVITLVLQHSKTPDSVYCRMMQHGRFDQWVLLVSHPRADDDMVLEIVQRRPDDTEVVYAALANHNISGYAFEEIADLLGRDWAAVVKLAREKRAARRRARRRHAAGPTPLVGRAELKQRFLGRSNSRRRRTGRPGSTRI